MKNILHTLLYKQVYFTIYLMSLLPMKLLYGIASMVCLVGFRVVGYRKAVVIQNISRSFPEMKYGEIRCVTKKFYTCFSSYFAEIVKTVSISARKLDQKLTFENIAIIDRLIAGKQNVIICLGHCGNWEMLNFLPYKLQHDVYAVYKPLQSAVMNRLMIKLRSRFGLKLITDKSVSRHILARKTSPSAYLFLADQCPRIKNDTYKFEFLGQETYFHSGMEKLAHISHAAVVYLYISQLARGHYKISCLPVCINPESETEGAITGQYADLLAKNISDEPYGWLWTHRRWKN